MHIYYINIIKLAGDELLITFMRLLGASDTRWLCYFCSCVLLFGMIGYRKIHLTLKGIKKRFCLNPPPLHFRNETREPESISWIRINETIVLWNYGVHLSTSGCISCCYPQINPQSRQTCCYSLCWIIMFRSFGETSIIGSTFNRAKRSQDRTNYVFMIIIRLFWLEWTKDVQKCSALLYAGWKRRRREEE